METNNDSRMTLDPSYKSGEGPCQCVVRNRNKDESQREWFKRWMCQYHWMQTDYYRNKLTEKQREALNEN